MKNQYVDVMKYYYLLRHKILKKKQTQTALKYYGIVIVAVSVLFMALCITLVKNPIMKEKSRKRL